MRVTRAPLTTPELDSSLIFAAPTAKVGPPTTVRHTYASSGLPLENNSGTRE